MKSVSVFVSVSPASENIRPGGLSSPSYPICARVKIGDSFIQYHSGPPFDNMPLLFGLLLLIFSPRCSSLRVLKSTLKLTEDGEAISGAKLEPWEGARDVDVTDLTLCIRFNYKLLGDYEGRSRLITIEDWREDEKVGKAI